MFGFKSVKIKILEERLKTNEEFTKALEHLCNSLQLELNVKNDLIKAQERLLKEYQLSYNTLMKAGF